MVLSLSRDVFDTILKENGVDMTDIILHVNDELFMGYHNRTDRDDSARQTITSLFSLNKVDAFLADEEHYGLFAKDGAFQNLSEVLEPEILNRFELYYVDGNPVGVVLPFGKVHMAGYYDDDVVAGIAVNSLNDAYAEIILRSLPDD